MEWHPLGTLILGIGKSLNAIILICYREEKSLNAFAKTRLGEMFSDLKVTVENGEIVIKKMSKYEGEAYSNLRKGTKRTGYDLTIKLDWEGHIENGTKSEGVITVKEITSEEDEYEFTYEVKSDDANERKFRDLLKTKVKAAICEQLRIFVKELKEQ